MKLVMLWITFTALPEGAKNQIFIPLKQKYDRTVEQELNLLLQKGYTRVADLW